LLSLHRAETGESVPPLPPFDIAADLDTPVSAYRKLAPFEPCFLLESVEGGQRLARYSFIGLGASLTLRLDADGLHINEGSGASGESGVPTGVPSLAAATSAESRDPRNRRRSDASAPAHTKTPTPIPDRSTLLTQLRAALQRAPRLLPEVPTLPLDGGLVGAIGYDFVRRLERLPHTKERLTGEPDALMAAPRSLLVFDHLTRRIALLHAGPEWERASLRREIIAALKGAHPPDPARRGHEPPTPSLSRDDFLTRVETVKEHIRAGDVFQLVLSIRFSGACRTSPFEVYRALRLLNPSPYMYFLDIAGTQVVGSSPEALVRLDGRTATLRPIAGTRPRGRDDSTDLANERELLADPKEAAEHVMLVDLARNDLGRIASADTIKVEPYRSIERYSHVMHIVSGVTGQLADDKDALDLFAAAFPAGTVVGAPKVRAMQIIDELEPVRRGIYAGTVGYFARGGNMDQAIAIRTLMFQDGQYAYQAGAGIVADSSPEAEHREILAKVGALEAALKLAEEGL
jgi:anthranilate synthase component I